MFGPRIRTVFLLLPLHLSLLERGAKWVFPLSYIPFLLPVSSPLSGLKTLLSWVGVKTKGERESKPQLSSWRRMQCIFCPTKDRSDPRFLSPVISTRQKDERGGEGRPRSWRDDEGFPLTSGPWVTLIVCSVRCICELHKVSGLFLAFIKRLSACASLSLSFAKILSFNKGSKIIWETNRGKI